MSSGVTVDWIVVGGDAAPWAELGLVPAVDGDTTRFPFFGTGVEIDRARPAGAQALVLTPADGGASAGGSTDIDGIEIVWRTPSAPLFAAHPLAVEQIDHVVITTDDLTRTCGAVADVTGAPLKRVREVGEMRQGFHRCGGLIIEVVERTGAPVSLWGLVLTVTDLDAAVAALGPERIGAAKDAVQDGRRIATMRTGAGLGCAVALMSPHQR